MVDGTPCDPPRRKGGQLGENLVLKQARSAFCAVRALFPFGWSDLALTLVMRFGEAPPFRQNESFMLSSSMCASRVVDYFIRFGARA
jgi:hypothetical protein